MRDDPEIIEVTDGDDWPLVREELRIVFFSPAPFPKAAPALAQLFDRWVAETPPEARAWALADADSETMRKVTPRLLAKIRHSFDPTFAETEEMVAFSVFGPQEYCPNHGFTVSGEGEDDQTEQTYVELRRPPPASRLDADEVFERARAIAELGIFDYGYVSRALACRSESDTYAFAQAVRGLVARHPGLDVGDNETAAGLMGTGIRGAYWITYLGDSLCQRVGGEEKIQELTGAGVAVVRAGPGWLLRAGPTPDRGDVNRRERLEPVRAVARLVVSLVGTPDETGSEWCFPDATSAEAWMRRHLEP